MYPGPGLGAGSYPSGQSGSPARSLPEGLAYCVGVVSIEAQVNALDASS